MTSRKSPTTSIILRSSTGADDPWSVSHIQPAYFENLFKVCKQAGAWPIREVWLGITGQPYAQQAGNAHPNAMIEAAGSSWIYEGRKLITGKFNKQRMRPWKYEEIMLLVSLNLESEP